MVERPCSNAGALFFLFAILRHGLCHPEVSRRTRMVLVSMDAGCVLVDEDADEASCREVRNFVILSLSKDPEPVEGQNEPHESRLPVRRLRNRNLARNDAFRTVMAQRSRPRRAGGCKAFARWPRHMDRRRPRVFGRAPRAQRDNCDETLSATKKTAGRGGLFCLVD